jgi:D-inositol-3-phosphate glycosyltransferase
VKIAMVSEHASPLATLGGVDAGGQNVHVAALAQGLARLGNEVVVHTRRDDPSAPRRVPLGPGVVVDHVDAGPPRVIPKDDLLPCIPEFAEDLRRCWSTDTPDVIHSHFWMSGLAALAAQPTGVPLVHTFHALGTVKQLHQGTADTSSPQRLDLERYIATAADQLIATCSDEIVELSRMRTLTARVQTVPCGVDLQVFRVDGPAQGRRAGLLRLVTLSRLVERKGIDDTIRALAQVPGSELIVAGGPEPALRSVDEETCRLRRLADRLGVADRVELRGRVARADVPALLRSADLVVCYPWYEPFGIVPLEAMACGVPVVAAAVGGMLDTVVNGVTGVHVPPRRPDLLAAALRRLQASPQQRAWMGVNGRIRAERLYSWDRVAHLTLRIYQQLCAPQPLTEVVT